eukprot:TRINITY_DN9799_c2_g1_i1.p1 TRINITY_DN9799_c2_g1~~TRINITY_DN9799_c2_g1_i1.p1  ORF type:complete len:218 (-),score=17.61 TRINITY_DN9799_c2_g1_i1:283-936(-)
MGGSKTPENLPIGPYFWQALLILPATVGAGFGTFAALLKGNVSSDEVRVTASEGFLACIFSVASMQGPFFELWSELVERDMGMPLFIHKFAAIVEFTVLSLRVCPPQPSRGGLSKALRKGTSEPDLQMARRCGFAHFLTCGIMGGALWTWPFGVKYPLGLVPGIAVLSASTTATDYWLSKSVTCAERKHWHLAAAGAILLGGVSAAMSFRLKKAGIF